MDWRRYAPSRAQLFGATSGVSPYVVHRFWVGWLVGRRLHMQALMQHVPIDVELATDETPIFPAVMDHAGLASVYSWRPGGAGAALWRRVFSGQIKTSPAAITETLLETPGRPIVSVAAAVPGERTQHAVIGWAEATPDGTVLGIAVIMPNHTRMVRSEPIPDTQPFANQRLGIWAAAPASLERARLTALIQAKTDPAGYRVATFAIGPDPEKPVVTLGESGIPPGCLHAAAFDYLKNHVDPDFQGTFLTTDGALLVGSPPMARRKSVPLDNPLPVATTMKVYWGVRAADGTLSFEGF